MEKENVVEDPTIVALAALRGYRIVPFRKDSGRIAFIVYGDDLERLLREILENKPVPIGDFLKSLKSIRSAIFTLKNLGNSK